MKITLRLVAAIWLSALLIIGGFAFFQIRDERERLIVDLERRAALLAESLKESVEPAARRGAAPQIARLLKKFGRPDRRIAVYDEFGSPLTSAPADAAALPPALPEITDVIRNGTVGKGLRAMAGRRAYFYATPLSADDRPLGALAVFVDASHLDGVEKDLWQYHAVRFFAVALGISIITFVVVRASVTRPLSAMAGWAKTLKTGKVVPPPDVADAQVFGPLAMEMVGLARRLSRAEAAAEQEAALRLAGEAVWTEERLKQFVRLRFNGTPVFVVSNREPVSHVRRAGKVVPQTPASGVVTAMDPVMRACGGVWVAHGSGDADRESADEQGRVGVPTDDPRYTLRRVWLDARGGARLLLRLLQRGAVAALSRGPRAADLPSRGLGAVPGRECEVRRRAARGDGGHRGAAGADPGLSLRAAAGAHHGGASRRAGGHLLAHPLAEFEAFGICPWQNAILTGMLGADLIGFHTQYHCNNFLDTVDRALEARIDAEHFAVAPGHARDVRETVPDQRGPGLRRGPAGDVAASRSRSLVGGLPEFLGVGVERVDYTKGLPERFRALRAVLRALSRVS